MKRVRKYTVILAYVLIALAIITLILGILLAISIIKFSDSAVISSKPFGIIMTIISLMCIPYSIYTIIIYKKQKKNNK